MLSQYQRSSGDRVLVSWIGGEPFLFPKLTELTVFFTRDLGLCVSATTNGTMLGSTDVREHVLDHYAELTFSVDGIGLVHDKLRGWRGGYEQLRKSIITLAQAKQNRHHGPLLRANVLLMRHTIKQFEPLCMELADWGIDEITFNQLGGRDRPEFFPANRLQIDDAVWLKNDIPRLRTQLSRLGVNLNGGSDYLFRILASSRDDQIPISNCRPGEKFLFIDEDAMASPCNFTTHRYGISLMELDCVDALTELPRLFSRLRANERLAACDDCHSTQVSAKFDRHVSG